MPNLGGWEWLVLLVLFVVPLVLFICAMVSIGRHQQASGGEKVMWVLASLFFPFLGSILWFAIGKKSARGALTQAGAPPNELA